MKCFGALALVVLMIGCSTVAAVAGDGVGPLVAGTAKGPMPVAAASYALGVHYPFGPAPLRGYPVLTGSHPRPFNGTFPYDEWPDRALVPGVVNQMSAEYVIMGSSRRN